ncbi:MAG: phosphate/phosphite/phosphonate ABC transporter substrate-binding protein [Actinomycetota bacterium]|nr:phosphate/phosphite/phosphonate ABC transporter substrate-binding protein [Actinomycetota bacterium]
MFRYPRAHRRPFLLRAVGTLVALTLVATACESDEDEEEGAVPASAEGGNAAREGWPEKLVFAAVPSEESSALQEGYKPILEVLRSELGLDIEFFQAADYAGVIEGQIAGNVDLAQYGPFSYVIARANGADIEPVGAMVDEKGGEPGYQSYGIVPAGSDIASLEDYAGKNVCFVDPSSTSGFLYPSAGLIQAGVDPESGIKPVFAGGHDASALSVASGDCEAGFAFDSMVDEVLIDSGQLEEGALEVVWKSEVIAGSPLAVRSDLPESLVSEINRVIIEQANVDHLVEVGICASEADCKLTDEEVWGYAKVDDAFYDGVRAVCESTKAEACKG